MKSVRPSPVVEPACLPEGLVTQTQSNISPASEPFETDKEEPNTILALVVELLLLLVKSADAAQKRMVGTLQSEQQNHSFDCRRTLRSAKRDETGSRELHQEPVWGKLYRLSSCQARQYLFPQILCKLISHFKL